MKAGHIQDHPLQGEALAHLLHDLRTPFNQLFGYAAILLEDADASGFSSVKPALRGIKERGEALLERIQAALSESAGGVSLAQVRALESIVRPEAERLLDAVMGLAASLRDMDAPDALADAGGMSASLRNLISRVQWVARGSEQELKGIAQ